MDEEAFGIMKFNETTISTAPEFLGDAYIFLQPLKLANSSEGSSMPKHRQKQMEWV